MADTHRQQIIIVGCGRLGVELALSLSHKKHNVSVIDVNARAFDRLGSDFIGRTIQGEAIDQDVLARAGVKEADAFAAVTSSDSVNIVTARVARDIFHIEHVVARIYNPRKAIIYEKLGIQTVATSAWGAQRFEHIILHFGLRSIGTVGNGDIQLYELTVPTEWAGKPANTLVPVDHAAIGAITRGGKSQLPSQNLVLQEHDILQVSATSQGASLLRERLKMNGD